MMYMRLKPTIQGSGLFTMASLMSQKVTPIPIPPMMVVGSW